MPFTCLFFSFWECASDDDQWMCSRDSVLTASPIKGKTISIYGAPMWPRLFGNRPKTSFYNNLLPFLKLYTWWLLPFEETGREISLNETAHNRKCFGAFLNIQVKWVMDTLCIFVFMYRVRQYRYYKIFRFGQLVSTLTITIAKSMYSHYALFLQSMGIQESNTTGQLNNNSNTLHEYFLYELRTPNLTYVLSSYYYYFFCICLVLSICFSLSTACAAVLRYSLLL